MWVGVPPSGCCPGSRFLSVWWTSQIQEFVEKRMGEAGNYLCPYPSWPQRRKAVSQLISWPFAPPWDAETSLLDPVTPTCPLSPRETSRHRRRGSRPGKQHLKAGRQKGGSCVPHNPPAGREVEGRGLGICTLGHEPSHASWEVSEPAALPLDPHHSSREPVPSCLDLRAYRVFISGPGIARELGSQLFPGAVQC